MLLIVIRFQTTIARPSELKDKVVAYEDELRSRTVTEPVFDCQIFPMPVV